MWCVAQIEKWDSQRDDGTFPGKIWRSHSLQNTASGEPKRICLWYRLTPAEQGLIKDCSKMHLSGWRMRQIVNVIPYLNESVADSALNSLRHWNMILWLRASWSPCIHQQVLLGIQCILHQKNNGNHQKTGCFVQKTLVKQSYKLVGWHTENWGRTKSLDLPKFTRLVASKIQEFKDL